MYVETKQLFTAVLPFIGFLLWGVSANAQIEAIGQCTGVTTDNNYVISITGIPAGSHTILFDGASVSTTATGLFTSSQIPYSDGSGSTEVKVFLPGTTDTTTVIVNEVLCTDIDGDGSFDFNTSICDYTKPLGTGGVIISTVAPYTGSNVYKYILTEGDSIYQSSSSDINDSGLFEDLSNGDYIVHAYNFLDEAEASTFISAIPDGTNLFTYAPGEGPTCFMRCGDASYTVGCESIVDIYVDPVDETVCMEGDATFFIQDSIIAPVPDLAVLTYQWLVDDGSGLTQVAGETDSVLNLTNVVFADSGNMYQVVVTLTVDGTEISMDTSAFATLTVYDDPILASGLDVTVNSDEETGIVLSTAAGSTAADSFEIISIDFGDLLAGAGNASTGVSDDPNVIFNDMYTNTDGGLDTAFYEIVPISEHGCHGDTVTVQVIVRPCPEVTDLETVDVCSDDFTGLVLPSTDDNGLTIDSFDITVTSQGGLVGTGTSGIFSDPNAISQDAFSNTTDLIDTVVYTITAFANDCESSSFTAKAVYLPEPIYADTTLTQCSDVALGYDIAFTDDSGLAIDSVDITVDNAAGTSGTGITSTGAIASDMFTNDGSASFDVVYTITPYAMGCAGASYTVTITITPEPVGTDPLPIICSDEVLAVDLATLISNSGDAPGFTWVAASNANVEGESDTEQTTATITDQLSNTSSTDQTVVYTVTPTGDGSCIGDPFTVTVTVHPEPTFDDLTAEVCSDEALDVDLSNGLTNAVGIQGYTYTVISSNDTDVPAAADRTDTTQANITDTYTNLTNAPVLITYTVTPISSDSCAGATFDVDVTVNPEPVLSASLDTTICSDALVGVILAVEGTSVAADSFEVVSVSPNGIASSGGNPITSFPTIVTDINEIADDSWTNEGTNPVQVIYQIAPITGGCKGDPVNIVVTVDPAAVVSVDSDATICSTESVDLTSIAAVITGGASEGNWSTADGTGTFNGGGVFGTATTYTPSEADKDAGTITLTLTSLDPTGVCGTDSASITIEVLDIRCSEFPWSGND